MDILPFKSISQGVMFMLGFFFLFLLSKMQVSNKFLSRKFYFKENRTTNLLGISHNAS